MSSLLFLFTKYTNGREKRERPPRYRPHFSRVTRETPSNLVWRKRRDNSKSSNFRVHGRWSLLGSHVERSCKHFRLYRLHTNKSTPVHKSLTLSLTCTGYYLGFLFSKHIFNKFFITSLQLAFFVLDRSFWKNLLRCLIGVIMKQRCYNDGKVKDSIERQPQTKFSSLGFHLP